MMTSDELEDAPQADGLLAYEREPIHLSLGVTIENLVKVCKIWSCLVFFDTFCKVSTSWSSGWQR